MVYKIFFAPNLPIFKIRLTKKREEGEKHANAKCYVFRPKAIIYCFMLFDLTGNIDKTVQRQHLN